MFPLNLALNLPEWYRLERETEKTVGRLTNLKELDYYLRNPDEYIRRLALIRLSELKPRDCENILREILDDHSENNDNKELAAWVLKATALKWNMEVFINDRYLTKFTGTENLSDINKITCGELQPSLRFNFSSNKVCSQIPASEDTVNYERDIVLDSGFSFGQWLSSIKNSMLISLKSLLLKFLMLNKKN
ncbi:MAG: HEAT repeat domain-containing protein, partial [Ruminiclostridium sp.]|nr:HEAT repeat domain-containing protein [Ruminiclostridium sp.]